MNVLENCIRRHWCPKSEEFTGSDSLIALQYRGWQVISYTIDDTYECLTQSIKIYHFVLQLGLKRIIMSVIANPYADRLVQELAQDVAHKSHAKKMRHIRYAKYEANRRTLTRIARR